MPSTNTLDSEIKTLVDDPGWPVEMWGQFDIDNMNCEYKNNEGGNSGALWCKGRNGPIECFEEDERIAYGTSKCFKGAGDEVHEEADCVL